MSAHQTAYKCTERIEPIIKRRLRRSQEWRNKRDELVNSRRKLGMMSPCTELDLYLNSSAVENTSPPVSEEKENKKINRKAKLQQKCDERLNMLKKWKEEKDLQRKQTALEKAKNKPFILASARPTNKSKFDNKWEQRLQKQVKGSMPLTKSTQNIRGGSTTATSTTSATTKTTSAAATRSTSAATRSASASAAAIRTTSAAATRFTSAAATRTTSAATRSTSTAATKSMSAAATKSTSAAAINKNAITAATTRATTRARTRQADVQRPKPSSVAPEKKIPTTRQSTRFTSANESRRAPLATQTTRVTRQIGNKKGTPKTTTKVLPSTKAKTETPRGKKQSKPKIGSPVKVKAVIEDNLETLPPKVTSRSDRGAPSFIPTDFVFTVPENLQSYDLSSSLSPNSTHSFIFGGFDEPPTNIFKKIGYAGAKTVGVTEEENACEMVEESEAVMEQDNAAVEESEDVVEQDNAAVEESEAVVEQDNAAVEESEDVVEQDNAAVEESEDVVEQDNAAVEGSEDVVEQDNAAVEESEDVVEQDNAAVEESEDVVEQDNAAVEESEAAKVKKFVGATDSTITPVRNDHEPAVFKTPVSSSIGFKSKKRNSYSDTKPSSKKKSKKSLSCHKMDSTRVPQSPEEWVELLKKSPMIEMTRRKMPKHQLDKIPTFSLENGDVIKTALKEHSTTSADEKSSETVEEADEVETVTQGKVVAVSQEVTGIISQETTMAVEQESSNESSQLNSETEKVDITEYNVAYFRNIVVSQTEVLNNLSDVWETIVPSLTEEVQGEVRSVIGQAKLLISQRFDQFIGLVDNCEFNTGEKETTCGDLQGFWDMVDFQVSDVKKKFADLQKLKDNNWQAEVVASSKPVKKIRKVKSESSKVSKMEGKSKFSKFLAQKKKAANNSPAVDPERETDSKEQVKVFDGHFFKVESPVKSPKPHCSDSAPSPVVKPVSTDTTKEQSDAVVIADCHEKDKLVDKTSETELKDLNDEEAVEPVGAERSSDSPMVTPFITRPSYVPAIPSPLLQDVTPRRRRVSTKRHSVLFSEMTKTPDSSQPVPSTPVEDVGDVSTSVPKSARRSSRRFQRTSRRISAVQPVAKTPRKADEKSSETVEEADEETEVETVTQEEVVAVPQEVTGIISQETTMAVEQESSNESSQLNSETEKVDITEYNVAYFRNIVVSQTEVLNNLSDVWETIVPSLTEEVQGEVRSVIGQAKLLISQRFDQFIRLVDNCEFNTGEKETTCGDLQGFWDMVDFQVSDVKKKFADLQKLKDNNWQAEVVASSKPVKKIRKVKPGASKVSKMEGKSKFSQFLTQKKKAANNSPAVDPEKETDSEEQVKVFDGHFFKVESPVRSPKPHCSDSAPSPVVKPVSTDTTKEQSDAVVIADCHEKDKLDDKTSETELKDLNDEEAVEPVGAERSSDSPMVTPFITRHSYVPAIPSPLLQDVTPRRRRVSTKRYSVLFSEMTKTPDSSQPVPSTPVEDVGDVSTSVPKSAPRSSRRSQRTSRRISAVQPVAKTPRKDSAPSPVVKPVSTDTTKEQSDAVVIADCHEKDKLDDKTSETELKDLNDEEAVEPVGAERSSDSPMVTPFITRPSYVPAIPSPLLQDVTPRRRRVSTKRHSVLFSEMTKTPDSSRPVPSTPVEDVGDVSTSVPKSAPSSRRRSQRISRRVSAVEPVVKTLRKDSTNTTDVAVEQLIDLSENSILKVEDSSEKKTPSNKRRSRAKFMPEVGSEKRRSVRLARLSVFHIDRSHAELGNHPDMNLIDFQTPIPSERKKGKRSKSVVFEDSLKEEESNLSALTTVLYPVSLNVEKDNASTTNFGKLKVGYTPVRSRQSRSSSLSLDEKN